MDGWTWPVALCCSLNAAGAAGLLAGAAAAPATAADGAPACLPAAVLVPCPLRGWTGAVAGARCPPLRRHPKKRRGCWGVALKLMQVCPRNPRLVPGVRFVGACAP